jgi:hypothetical protein
MRWILVLPVATLATAAVAEGKTPAEKFTSAVESRVAPRYGTIATGKFKALCVCNSNYDIGVVESFGGGIPNLRATCSVPSFDGAGNYSGGFACYDWTPLRGEQWPSGIPAPARGRPLRAEPEPGGTPRAHSSRNVTVPLRMS